MALGVKEVIPAERAELFRAEYELPAREKPPQEDGRDTIKVVSSSGEVLEERGLRDDAATEDGWDLHPGTLVAFDPETGEEQLLRGEGDLHDGTQTTFSALDDDYAVWSEEPGTSLTITDWSLYAVDRDTREIFLVDKAQPVDATGLTPTVPGYTIPSLNDGWVYWAAAKPNQEEGKPPVVNVYGRNLDTREPVQLVVENANMPVATGDWLYYAEFDPERWKEPEYAIYRRSLTTGETELIDESQGRPDNTAGRAAYLAAHGDTVAWSLSSKVLVFTGTTQVAEVTTDKGSLVWLDAGSDMISFKTSNTGNELNVPNYLLDLRSGCLYDLGEGFSLDTKLSGDVVLWHTNTEDTDRPWLPHVGIRR